MAQRNVMTVLREIAAVKAGVKDLAARQALLAPLEAEIVAMAEAAKRQLDLALTPPSKK